LRALLSVYDKTGIEAFARGLEDLGWDLVASGKTSRALADGGIKHRQVADVTGAAEMLDGRVKTLHPVIHGGILADRSKPSHIADLDAQGIDTIDLVACNLYPFTSEPSIEMIDIGGPTMVRAAAKNHAHVTVIVHPDDYMTVLDELRRVGAVSADSRRRLARAAFAHTAAYDAAIVGWFDELALDEARRSHADAEVDVVAGVDPLPLTLHLALERAGELRYGENPHQAGALYRVIGGRKGWADGMVQHGGLALSYLNIFDADAAWKLAHELAGSGNATSNAAAVIVKHANPCGAAIADDIDVAYSRAFAADPMSAFGGIVALTQPVSAELAKEMVDNPLADLVIAPGYEEGALALFAARRKNMRVLAAPAPGSDVLGLRQIDGGFLVQEQDRFLSDPASWRVVSKAMPTAGQWRDIELVWRVCGRTTSNAIVVGLDGQVLGVGCGQQSRVEAAEIATRKAAGRARGGAGASDAFFPFRDGVDALAAAGVAAIVQPGGSLRDDEVIAAADEHGIAMVMTAERHFKH
jgi:phosphoribosylaminoimidazolecarboxamide formyltransferase/IMP cyclohydrolase